jgi:hypothetical protein
MLVASTTAGPSTEQGGVLDLTAARIVSCCAAATVRLRPVARPSAAVGCAAPAQMVRAVQPKGKGTSS